MKNHIYFLVVSPYFHIGQYRTYRNEKWHLARDLETGKYFIYGWGRYYGVKPKNAEIEEQEIQRWLDNGWIEEINDYYE